MAAQLAAWNSRYKPGLLAPTLFEVWFDWYYYGYSFWDEMYTLREVKKDMLPDSWRLIDLMKNDAGNVFFDRSATPARETARNVVQESFQAMVTHFRQNPKEKTDWAHAKGFAIRHLAPLTLSAGLMCWSAAIGMHRRDQQNPRPFLAYDRGIVRIRYVPSAYTRVDSRATPAVGTMITW